MEYNYHQLGLTEAWFRERADKIGDPLTVRREILLQRLQGSSQSPYPREEVEAIVELVHKPIRDIFLQDYFPMYLYEELDPRIPYLVGVDNATGSLKDNNAFTVINPYTLRVVAEFESNFSGPKKWEDILIELVTKYIPRAILCIERNHVGAGILDHLCYSPIANNIYFDDKKDLVEGAMVENETTESILKKQASERSFYGVWTGPQSRPEMFTILADHIYNHKDKFIGEFLVRDITRLIQKPNGKIEAGPKFHDDSVMSYLIAMYVYYHGNNLMLFGVDKGKALSEQVKNDIFRNDVQRSVETTDLPEEIKNIFRRQEEKKRNTENYEEILRKAIMESQQETIRLEQSTVNQDSIYTATPESVYMGTDYGSQGSIPFSFFREINS